MYIFTRFMLYVYIPISGGIWKIIVWGNEAFPGAASYKPRNTREALLASSDPAKALFKTWRKSIGPTKVWTFKHLFLHVFLFRAEHLWERKSAFYIECCHHSLTKLAAGQFQMWSVGENRNENPGILTSPTLFGKWPSSLDCKHKLCNQITTIRLQPQVELCWWIKSRICNWTHCQYDFHLIWLWFDFDLNTLPECDFDLFSFFDNMLFAKAGPGLIGQSLWVFIMTGNL